MGSRRNSCAPLIHMQTGFIDSSNSVNYSYWFAGLSPRLSHVIETMAGTQRRGDTPKFVPPQFENRQRFKSDSVSLDSGLRAAFSHENRGPNKEQVEIILAQKEYHEQWQQERERKLAEEQARRRALLERERLERDRRLKAEREAINQQRHELERQKRLREQEERQRRLEIEKQREAREAQERSSREARRAAEAQRANEERQRSLDEQKRRVRQEIEAKRAEEERRARAEIQAREAKVQKENARREMEIQASETKRAERKAAEERQRAAREMEGRRSQALPEQEQRQTYPRDHKGIPVVIGDAHAELARQRAEQERQPQRSSPSPAMQGSASRPDLLGSQLGSPRVQTISRATADLLVGSLVQPPSPTSPPRVINPTTPEPWISLTSITSVSEGSPRHQNTWYAPTVTASAIMVPTPRHNVEERLFTDRPSFTTKPKDNSPPRVPSLNLPVTASTVAPSLTPPAGIGISFVPDQDGNLLIAHLVPGGPAQATGNLFVGDRLLSVSGQPGAGKTVPEVIRMVLGPKDSEVSTV